MLSGSTLLRHLAQFYCAIYSREHFTAGQVIEGQAISAHGQPIIWYELTPEATK